MQMRSLLTGVLAAQVVLAGSLFFYHQSQNGARQAEPLLEFAEADVDKIVVQDNANSATLVRDGDTWQLADLAELPANAARIDTLLGNLAGIRTQWPVVSSAAGRERLEVADDKFQRRLTLYRNDTQVGELYFGTSPGFRQTHARRAGDDDVYAITFNNFDLPADDNDWLDKELLAVADVTAIKGQDFELSKNAEGWQLAALPSVLETGLDTAKAEGLATALRNLRVLRVADAAPAGESRALSVTTKDGVREFVFTKAGTEYFVKRDDRAQSFTISSSDYDKLGAVARATLLQALPSPAEAQSASQPETVHAGSASAEVAPPTPN
jgi:hypothetical protein